ncbi:MAG: glycosyltransferase family 4 protein [Saprospiraceae bacterium]
MIPKIKKLAIVSTHPIQYNAPLFRLLAERSKLAVKVFYTWGQAQDAVYDPGFGKERRWDIPLLEGYDYLFLPNTAKDPGSHHFGGIVNPTILTELQAYQADAILVYGWSFRSHLQVLRYFKGKVKLLFRGDSNLLDEPTDFSLKKVLRRLFLSWVYRQVDTALYVGTANRAYYQRHGLRGDKLVFAPHAIDNDRFAGDAEARASAARSWRSHLGIPAEALVFLFVGKLEAKKNPRLLLEAFGQIKHPDARLLFVGNGPEESLLKAQATTNPRVLFIDFQNQQQMPLVYRLGDVLVLPSQGPGETWGLAVNEAFACARPAIVSDKVGCAADLVQPGRSGWIFPSGELQALRKSMEAALAMGKDGLAVLGRQAHQVIQSWSFTVIAEALEKTVNHAD